MHRFILILWGLKINTKFLAANFNLSDFYGKQRCVLADMAYKLAKGLKK